MAQDVVTVKKLSTEWTTIWPIELQIDYTRKKPQDCIT